MSLPYIFESSWDTGDASEWDSEQDTGSALDIVHYREMARFPGYPAPYRGAYCMRILDIADTNEHSLKEGDMNIAVGDTAWVRFAMYIDKNFTATADDSFNIFEWQKADNTVENSMGLKITEADDLITIGVADGTAVGTLPGVIVKGQWTLIECKVKNHGSAGTMDLYIDGSKVQALTGLAQSGAIAHCVLGTQDTAATTDFGYILFDAFAFDDTRLGLTHRWERTRLVTTSSFLFVGPGSIEDIKIIDGGSGDVTVELYDTDTYVASMTPRWRGRTTIGNTDVDATPSHLDFSRGCLVVLGGTLPAAQITVGKVTGWGSEAAVRNVAHSLPDRVIA